MWKFWGCFWSVRISLGTDLAICIIIYIINCVLVSRRPEMGTEFCSTKRNQCRRSGLPVDSPHVLFLGLLKTVPGLCELDQNRPYVVCLSC